MSSYRSHSADLYFWDKKAGERYAKILRENTPGRLNIVAGRCRTDTRRDREMATPADQYMDNIKRAAALIYLAAIFVLSFLAF